MNNYLAINKKFWLNFLIVDFMECTSPIHKYTSIYNMFRTTTGLKKDLSKRNQYSFIKALRRNAFVFVRFLVFVFMITWERQHRSSWTLGQWSMMAMGRYIYYSARWGFVKYWKTISGGYMQGYMSFWSISYMQKKLLILYISMFMVLMVLLSIRTVQLITVNH